MPGRAGVIWKRAGRPGAAAPKIPQAPAGDVDRRLEPRSDIRRTATAFPVLPDGRPDIEHQTTGMVIDISKSGIGLEIDLMPPQMTSDWMIGVEGPDGAFQFAGARVKRQSTSSAARVRVGCCFGGIADELLNTEADQHQFAPQTLTFVTRFPEVVLDAWSQAGVLHPFTLDRVQVCPRCAAVPTFRPACRQCGSSAVENDVLIHHFACAHVGAASDFETGAELVCPKCRTRSLMVNSDFEFVAGPYRCRNCQWADMELESMGQCLACGHRFPARDSRLQELRGYRVRRLDLLAVSPTS